MATEASYFCGIDWASQKHDVCIIDPQGKVVSRFCPSHTAEGLTDLVRRLRRFGSVLVAIERPSGLLVDTLLEAGFTVVPIHPNQLKATRPRYSAAQAKSDPGDAYILADLLRTDGHRFRVLHAPSDQTRALRAAVRTRDDLVHSRVQICNQLRSLLEGFWPGPLGLFSELDNAISLSFLECFPTPQSAARLNEPRMGHFLQSHRYCGRTSARTLLARLRAAAPGQTGEEESRTRGALVLSLVAILRTLGEEIRRTEKLVRQHLRSHPDAVWLSSFPYIGEINAAQILAELGDESARYASADQLAAEGGVAPVTRASGRHRAVLFRYACNTRLRCALTAWANNSRHGSAWAADLYEKAIARGCSHPHAVRILARAWVGVLWRCWSDRVSYDPHKHGSAAAFLKCEPPAAVAA